VLEIVERESMFMLCLSWLRLSLTGCGCWYCRWILFREALLSGKGLLFRETTKSTFVKNKLNSRPLSSYSLTAMQC